MVGISIQVKIHKSQPKLYYPILTFRSHHEIFNRRSWYSVLPSLDATISCRIKKAVVGVTQGRSSSYESRRGQLSVEIHTAIRLIQCIVNGEENPHKCLFPWEYVTPPEEDRATAIGNIHKDFVKIARVVRIYDRGQTNRYTHIDTHTDARSLGYNTSLPLPAHNCK